jgi:hypothetical protein
VDKFYLNSLVSNLINITSFFMGTNSALTILSFLEHGGSKFIRNTGTALQPMRQFCSIFEVRFSDLALELPDDREVFPNIILPNRSIDPGTCLLEMTYSSDVKTSL